MSEPRWLSKSVVLAIHGRLLAEHGGASGLRDEGLLDSALASPRNHHAHGEHDIFELGAAYAFSLIHNHPFIDGNRRVAFTCAGVFLEINGARLIVNEGDAVQAVLALSTGDLDRSKFAAWLRRSSERTG